MEELSGQAPVADEQARAAAVRKTLEEQLPGEFPCDWLRTQLAAMPLSYLLTTEPQRVAAHLRVLQRFSHDRLHVETEYAPETGISGYTVFTSELLTTGIFSKIAGVLAATGFQVLSAQIVTRVDGIVLDTFRGIDLDHAGEPPPARRRELSALIEQVLLGERTVESLFTRRGNPQTGCATASSSAAGPDRTQVEIDNESSDRFTIIEVFADDRQGLLYVITRTLFELGLSVSSAKISTRLDQVVDAFYVTGRSGQKLTDEARLSAIQQRLLAAIETFGQTQTM
jgi:[protein-PII] uridylyltransferase